MNDTENPQLDMSMEIARLEAELADARATIERLNRRAQAAESKLLELEDHGAKNVKLNQRIAELEADISVLRSAREECLLERDRLDIQLATLKKEPK